MNEAVADARTPIIKGTAARVWKFTRLVLSVAPILLPPYILFIGESSQTTLFNEFGLPGGLQDRTVSGDFTAGIAAIVNASATAIFISVLLVSMFAGMAIMAIRAVVDLFRAIDRKAGRWIRSASRTGIDKLREIGCFGPLLLLFSPLTASISMGLLYITLSSVASVLSVGYDEGVRMAEVARSSARICAGITAPEANGAETDCVSVTSVSGERFDGFIMPTDQQLIVIDKLGRANWMKVDDGLTIIKSTIVHPPLPDKRPVARQNL